MTLAARANLREKQKPLRPAEKVNLSSTLETIDNGCPLCQSTVKGNDKYLFYCRKCNLLFRRKHCRTR